MENIFRRNSRTSGGETHDEEHEMELSQKKQRIVEQQGPTEELIAGETELIMDMVATVATVAEPAGGL